MTIDEGGNPEVRSSVPYVGGNTLTAPFMGNTGEKIESLIYRDTYIRIENDTDIDIVDTEATNYDSYDWKPGRRPDHIKPDYKKHWSIDSDCTRHYL